MGYVLGDVTGGRLRQFLVIEGLIGVGKTTLCRLLQETWNAKLILEPAETNPFLGPFYSDPERYAFSAQMFLSRKSLETAGHHSSARVVRGYGR